MGQLDDKVTIITGAGTGIGKGMARAFAKEGARLVLASRNQANLEETATETRGLGVQTLIVPTDVTDEAQVIALFEKTMAEFGRVDILINNSGAFDGGPLESLSLETWLKVLHVNLTAHFFAAARP
jgi:NAD(P)-dependent dehydrogenase (short-subunit alcohol dehydrogenase family)